MKMNQELTLKFINLVAKGILKQNDYDNFARCTKIAIKLHRHYIYACNGTTREKLNFENWNDYQTLMNNDLDRIEQVNDKLIDKLDQLTKKMNVNYFIQSDPRGGTLYLDTKEINQSNYTNSYFII
jgi:hypothetical protein